MEITEEKLYRAWGLDPEEGGKESEVAEQSEAPEQEEAAEENSGIEAQAEEEAAEPAPEEGGNESDVAEQTPEQRRENAARRRQQETQAAIEEAVRLAVQTRDRQHEEEMQNFFGQAGLVNPFTKEPITNMEEFRAWREEQDNQKLQKELQSGKLTKETLNGLIEQNPAVQAARQAQLQETQRAQQAQEQAFLQDVETQLQEIRKTDPSIRNVSDLMNRPYSQEFYAAVKRGNNFLDAFYLATRGQQLQETGEKARQSAVNNLTGKNHLKATSIGGKAGASITPEEREMYRLFNPGATDAEIQKFQNRVKKAR